MPTSRILLVDDHEVVRMGLKSLIERQPNLEVVAEAATEKEAVQKALAYHPDIVLMDIRLKDGSGIAACEQIMAQLPCTKVIMLTSYAEDEMLFAAIRVGAVGYVLKQLGSQNITRSIEAAARGEATLDPSLTQTVFQEMRRSMKQKDNPAFAELTTHEKQVLALITKGWTNHEIAQELFLSEGTVRNYVSHMLSKLSVANRAEAAAYAIQHHLMDYLPEN
jgi:DNA-binding NarL/FixJ family response regulator